MKTTKYALAGALLLAISGLPACHRKAETIGEKLDKATQTVEDKAKDAADATKRATRDAGDKADDAVDAAKKKARDVKREGL